MIFVEFKKNATTFYSQMTWHASWHYPPPGDEEVLSERRNESQHLPGPRKERPTFLEHFWPGNSVPEVTRDRAIHLLARSELHF